MTVIVIVIGNVISVQFKTVPVQFNSSWIPFTSTAQFNSVQFISTLWFTFASELTTTELHV
jgi:hypothetical protein